MTDDCRHHDDVAAWVLGALDGHEATGFAAHLEGCDRCRAEIADLEPATQRFALGVKQVEAPEALRDRIMAVVNAEAELLAAAGPVADRPAVRTGRRRRSWFSGISPLFVGAFACVLLAVGVAGGIVVDNASNDPTHSYAGKAQEGMSALATVKDDHVTLHFEGMKPPPTGRVYQVWFMRDGKVIPTKALFTVALGGGATVKVPEGLHGADHVLVSHEPKGGSKTPTSTPSVDVSIS